MGALIWGIFCICLAVFLGMNGVLTGTAESIVIGALVGHGVVMAIIGAMRA